MTTDSLCTKLCPTTEGHYCPGCTQHAMLEGEIWNKKRLDELDSRHTNLADKQADQLRLSAVKGFFNR